MNYLLLFCTNAQDLAAWQELSEEVLAHKRAQASQWLDDHRSQIRKSYGLHLPHTVTSVHVGSGGQPLVTDGPFLEGTEVIGGVAEIEVADLDEALRLAKAWSVHAPGYNVVEIWPVVVEPHTHV
ncbi:YCII-related protein [Ktedonobacter racemifer DSM 44963]|uniref:YCII-related protein n=2 Tax=Ktedonobacter racemifer TaxID=363277 RepID=D6U2M2_KTERA|nr:YCII-related protein [Ktedonobacter racemifer DSM 44963]